MEIKKVQINRALDDDLKACFSSDAGVRSLFWLLHSVFGLWEPTFTGNSKTYLFAGLRDAGVQVLDKLGELDETINLRVHAYRQDLLREELIHRSERKEGEVWP